MTVLMMGWAGKEERDQRYRREGELIIEARRSVCIFNRRSKDGFRRQIMSRAWA